MSAPFWDQKPSNVTAEILEEVSGGTLATRRTDLIHGPEGKKYAEHVWDLAGLGGMLVPGLVSVYVVDISRRLQQSKHNGSDGATPIYRGLNPARVDIEVVLWTDEQLAEWESVLRLVFPQNGAPTDELTPVDISHPVTSMLGIRSVIVERITGLAPGPWPQTKSQRLSCIEFVLPTQKVAVKSPDKSKSNVKTTKAFQNTKNTATKPSEDKSVTSPSPAPAPHGGSH